MRSRYKRILTLTMIFVALPCNVQASWKMQPLDKDPWYYYDNNFPIRAPDKWTHMMGSKWSTEIAIAVTGNRTFSVTFVFLGGVFKEYLDGYELGWSPKDLLMNITGIGAALWDDKHPSKVNMRYIPKHSYKSKMIWLEISFPIS